MTTSLTTSMTIDQIIEALKAAKAENGSVTFEGTEYILADQAYASNTDGAIVYIADAYAVERDIMDYEVGGDLIQHRVTWDVIDGFDGDDESNACDWDSPVSVTKC